MLADPKLKEVHPLGKSPVIEIESPATDKPLVIAESGAIVEYLLDHWGRWLVPKRYREGKEDQVGGETESWVRHRMYMHYAEGSIMPLNIVGLLVQSEQAYPKSQLSASCADSVPDIRNAPVPFFIRPITNSIATRIQTSYLTNQFELHYQFIEDQLATSPDGGDYLCGKEITGADILMSFPLEAGNSRSGVKQEKFPKVFAYVEKLHEREAYKRATEKIIEVEGQFKTTL
jgi:glutathione S-transferase